MFIGWSILVKVILSRSTEKYCLLPETSEERAFVSYWTDFYISTFKGKYHLSPLTRLRTKHCFASSRDKMYFVCEKVLKIAQQQEKSLMCLRYFGWWWEFGRARTTSLFPTLRSSWTTSRSFFFFICQFFKNIFRCFEVLIESMHTMMIKVYFALCYWLEDDGCLDWWELHLGS